MLMPNSLAILGAPSPARRGAARSASGRPGAVLGAVGPVLGGWLIDAVGWRAIFLINLPLALAPSCWPGVCGGQPRGNAPARLDSGGVLATAALGTLTWGLTIGSGPRGWTVLAMALTVGMALDAGFLSVEHRSGEHAMMPLALFGSPSFVGLTLLTLLLYGALGALLVLMPYVLIPAAVTPAPARALLCALRDDPDPGLAAMGRLAGGLGPRWPLTLGPLVVAARVSADAAMGADAITGRMFCPAFW